MSTTRVESRTPLTDHLWKIGFTLKAKADRLPIAIPTDEGALVTNFELLALPERGEARRLFAAKGAVKSEVKSNVPLERLQAERDRGDSTLKDLYTEKCAVNLFDLLAAAAPQIRRPGTTNA
jgi:hypothetical protein